VKSRLHFGVLTSGIAESGAWRWEKACAGLAAVLVSALTLAGCGSSAEDLSKIGAATYRGPATTASSSAQVSGQGGQSAAAGKSKKKKALTKPVAPADLASGAEAVGSAFYINSKGQLLTTWQQVRSCRRVAVMDNFELRHVRVTVSSPLSGLAVLDAAETTEIYALFRGAPVAAGEPVTAVVHPILDGVFMPLELTRGRMEAPMGGLEQANAVLRTTAFREGQSAGGPIIDASGNVVGITVGKLRPEWPGKIGYGIGADMILRFADSTGVGVLMIGQGDAPQDAAPFAGDYTVPVICFR
jgi:S1-C subfamily serine protease